jgi:hypothetical protein
LAVFSSFDPPGSTSTTINGVNDLGQIVGFYTDAGANVIGFLATPNATPATPASVSTLTEWGMILLSGILGLFGLAQIRRRGKETSK